MWGSAICARVMPTMSSSPSACSDGDGRSGGSSDAMVGFYFGSVDSAINVRGANGSGAASDFDYVYVYVYGYGRYDGAARGRYVDDAASVEDREAKGTKLGDDVELWRERAVHGRYVAR